jgi:peptidoglycan hydrolase-like protein with peptidoglycan-binding domain
MVFLTVSVGVIVFRQSQSPSEQAIVASRQPTSEAIKKEVNLEDLALAKADADREVADDAVLTPPLTEMAPGARTPLPSERESMIQRRLKSLGYTGSTRATAKVETPAPAVPQQIELKTAEAMEAAPAAPLPMRAEERAAELADVAKPPKPSAMPRLKAVPAELDDPQDPVVDQSLEITCPTESARLHHASMIEAFVAENDIEVIQAASESPVAEGSGKDTADPAAGETTYVAMIDPDQIRQLNAMLAASAAVDALAWSKQKSNQREEKTREAPVVADRLRVGGEGAHPSSAAAVQPPTDELTFSRDPKGSAPAAAAPKPNDQITPRVGAMRPADVTIDQPAQRARSDEKADRSTAQPPTKLRVQIRVISRPPVR